MKKLLLLGMLLSSGQCFAQNFLDSYLSGTPTFSTIAGSSQGVSAPRDLDFKPNTNELWVVNKGTSNGSSVVIVYNAGQSNQVSQHRFDSHAGHFLIYASAIAFGDNGNWGSTNEIRNTAEPSSTFMGPALWSGDTSIFARVFQNNWDPAKPLGSHLDMLHQSPFSMGIAHDSANFYWVFDGHNGNLCKYDFGRDHAAGYDDHSNGRVWRYTDVPLTREVDIPGHMIKDKATGWLYIVDAGTKKLKRVNTKTGSITGTLTVPASGGEPLLGYWAVTGAQVQELDSFPTSQPSGIDLYNGRLVVSDYDNGNIYIYDITGATPVKLGTIATGQITIMGVKIGADGRIWFVNHNGSTVVRINPATTPNNDAAIDAITSPLLNNTEPNFYHTGFNVCSAGITPVVVLKNTGANTLTTATISYRIDNGAASTYSWSGSLASGITASVTLPSITAADGPHKLTVSVSNPNGSSDVNPANNTKEGSFRLRFPVVAYPFSENFNSSAFPPPGWSYVGYNFNNVMGHEASYGSFGANNGTLFMDNYSGEVDISGQQDFLLLPAIDMTGAASNALLSFTVAYAQYDPSSNDALSAMISTDCGATWTQVYHKSGTALKTANPTQNVFYPAANQWRTEVVPVSAYAGQANVMVKFIATSNFGNRVYLDNINVSSTVGIKEQGADLISVFPNPTTGRLSVSLNDHSGNAAIRVTDIIGKSVQAAAVSPAPGRYEIDLSGHAAGTYFLTVEAGGRSFREKITLVR